MTPSCLLIMNNAGSLQWVKTAFVLCGELFYAFALFICVSGMVATHICSPQYTVQQGVWSSVCVCASVCSFPGEISCLRQCRRGWQMTTRSLVSLICHPLRRHKHTSGEFPAPFLSLPHLAPVLSFFTLLRRFLLFLLSSRLLSALFFALLHLLLYLLSPLLSSPAVFTTSHLSFSLLCLCCSSDRFLRHCLSLFPTVIHDLPAD